MTGEQQMESRSSADPEPAIIHGPPLEEEPGLGALTLPGYLREVTTRFSEREALVYRDGGADQRWTYAELWQHATTVARSLLALDCGKDTRVGVLMTNRPEWLAAVFGASIAGCVAVPLSTFSTPPELEFLLQSSAVGVLLAERRVVGKDFGAMLRELSPGLAQPDGPRSVSLPHLRHVVLLGDSGPDAPFEVWDDFLARADRVPVELAEATAAQVDPTDHGAIMFSSGSTARPKGVIHTQRGIAIHLWRWQRIFGLEGEVRTWTPNGFFWSGNFAGPLGGTLTAGGTLLLQSVFDAEAALALMAAERVTFPYAWPHQWKQLLEAPNWADVDLSSVHFLDPCQPLSSHPTIRLGSWREPASSYGATETFTLSCGPPYDEPREAGLGTHGRALPGNTVKIVDPLSGEALARGAHGEIAVKGPTLMAGYLGVPPEQAFDAEGFFRSGDAGWIDDAGWLHWEGRLSTVIKTGGANVSPVEVDTVLESMPGVKVARCVGVPDPDLGELVVACVVPAEGHAPGADEVRSWARERLASYKVPRRVLFFDEQELSLTSSAKVRSGELRDKAVARLAAAGD